MGNHLRIEIAELTDIGRRRTTNQDNLGRRVPDDPEEIGRKGALFVVADGMGGHAAGEIASTVAVQTICNTYPDLVADDIMQALHQSIKRANETILSIARANTDHLGMGTTVVAAVLCDGVLYVANIGDSRGYLLRDGQMRQITVDHSWVGEQVRAGILTEEQARTHIHRNVITRSLGTQPDVTADIFVEPLRNGDIVLLCSDGLHGYVEDRMIAETAQSLDPAPAVRKLVDLANEAGGPDNITVTIVRVEETPDAPEALLQRLVTLNGRRQSPSMPLITLTTKRPPVQAPAPPEPVENDKLAPLPIRRPRRARALWLTLLTAAALIAFSALAWSFAIGPYTQQHYAAARVQNDLSAVQADVASLSTLTPAQQIAALAADQQKLTADLRLDVTSQERAQLQTALDTTITPAARLALQAYNAQAHIIPFDQTTPTTLSLQCAVPLAGPLLTLPPPPAPATPTGTKQPLNPATTTPQTFAVTAQNQLVPLTFSATAVSCGAPAVTNVIGAALDGTQLDLLIKAATPGQTTIVAFHADGTQTPLATLSILDDNKTPRAIAAAPGQIAVLAHSSTGGDIVYLLAGPTYDVTKAMPLSPTRAVRDMALGQNGVLYLLQDDGSLVTYPDATQFHPVGGLQVMPVIFPSDPALYTSATPLPATPGATGDAPANPANGVLRAAITPTATPAPTATPTPAPTPTPTPIVAASTLLTTATNLVSDAEAVPRLAVLDAHEQRLIILQSNGGLDLTLVQQYVDPTLFGQVTAFSLSPDGHTLTLCTPASIVTLSLP